MRKFIVSDLHGNGNIYKSIMGYLENINKEDEIILYINGDLIDRGVDSPYMLLDTYNRIINNKGFKIKYIAGNHELMMYNSLNGDMPSFFDIAIWFSNGGEVTNDKIQELLNKKEKLELIKFISELDIYHKFNEKINDKNIVLVHAKCPNTVKDICDLKVKENYKIHNYVWTREENLNHILKESLGNDNYFTIIGHTQTNDKKGYKYLDRYNCLNIDGGCAAYALGYKKYDHTPLVEIDNNKLNILTFNNNNEIIYGNYFENKKSIPMTNEELEKSKKYIAKDVKKKKLEYM